MNGAVSIDVQDAIASLTLRNPVRRNALDTAMVTRLIDALRQAETDPGIAVIVLGGADGHFCAGADLSELADAQDDGDCASGIDAAESAILHVTKPTIAVVEGVCFGAGVSLMLACDLAVASATARIAVTAARIGVVYPAGPTERLVERVGPAAALRMLYTGMRLDAPAALQLGLIDEVHEDAHDAGLRLASTIAGNSLLAVRAAKDAVSALRQGDRRLADVRVRAWQRTAADSGELAEGLRAFAERRAAQFPWRPPSSQRSDQSGSK